MLLQRLQSRPFGAFFMQALRNRRTWRFGGDESAILARSQKRAFCIPVVDGTQT